MLKEILYKWVTWFRTNNGYNNNTLLLQITLYSRIRNLHFSIIKISNKLQATNQHKVSGQNIFEIKLTRDRQRQCSVKYLIKFRKM